MKKNFRCNARKNETGVVTVMTHKSGFRTVIVEGKLKVPIFITNLLNLNSIVASIGAWFPGLFPSILKTGRNNHIDSYSFPEYFQTSKPKYITFCYEYTFLVNKAAVNMSASDIACTVLTKNKQLADKLLESINESIIAYSSQDP